jgi:hypothetical protein
LPDPSRSTGPRTAWRRSGGHSTIQMGLTAFLIRPMGCAAQNPLRSCVCRSASQGAGVSVRAESAHLGLWQPRCAGAGPWRRRAPRCQPSQHR